MASFFPAVVFYFILIRVHILYLAVRCSLDLALKDLFDSPMYVALQSLRGILYTMLFCRSAGILCFGLKRYLREKTLE